MAVVWHVTMSVDGFIAGADDDMRWAFEYSGTSDLVADVIDSTGAIVMGRRTYEVGVRTGRQPYGGAWKGPVFVVTHDPPERAADPATATFVSAGVEDAVRRAQSVAVDKNVVVFGASTTQQCLDAGLLDELILHLAPVLLGEGIRLFGGRRHGPIRLERTFASESGPLMDLRFRVVR
jgi:dihydrofolate reductase